jgi:dTMP kinase
LRKGYSVISDRYVYDTVINDLSVDRGLSINDAKMMTTKLWKHFPKPTLTFLIRVPEEVAIKRKNDIPSLNYLRIRNQYYDEILKDEGCFVLDGTVSIDELRTLVIKKINESI